LADLGVSANLHLQLQLQSDAFKQARFLQLEVKDTINVDKKEFLFLMHFGYRAFYLKESSDFQKKLNS
jgi:hypothetical protein